GRTVPERCRRRFGAGKRARCQTGNRIGFCPVRPPGSVPDDREIARAARPSAAPCGLLTGARRGTGAARPDRPTPGPGPPVARGDAEGYVPSLTVAADRQA